MKHVREILANKGHDVATIMWDRSVLDGLEVLRERGIGALVVTSPTSSLAGIFSERDVVRALAELGPRALDMNIAALMSGEVTTCAEDTAIDNLMVLMTDQRIRHVPVVHNSEVVGMISIGDVVKWRVDELEQEKRELLEYVSAR